MKLVPCSLRNINSEGYRKSYLLRLLEEFEEHGLACAKVEGYTHKSAEHCTSSINQAIRRYKMTHLRAVTRKGIVYLINTTVKED